MSDTPFEAFKSAERFKEVIGARKPALADETLPDGLRQMYSALGCGGYGGGLLWVLEPQCLRPVFDAWMLPREGVTRIPFARTAFGDLLYVAFTEGGEPSPGLLDLHYKSSRPAYATDVADFFDRVATMDDWAEEELRTEQFALARQEHGDLQEDQCYYFVPALAIGGSEDGPFDKGSWQVHADLLLQM